VNQRLTAPRSKLGENLEVDLMALRSKTARGALAVPGDLRPLGRRHRPPRGSRQPSHQLEPRSSRDEAKSGELNGPLVLEAVRRSNMLDRLTS
jgi:hypothetical protein